MAESSSIPVSGSLEAKIIRACTVHRKCPLTCRERKVEDLGEVARFKAPSLPDPSVGLRTGRPATPTVFDKLGEWFERITH